MRKRNIKNHRNGFTHPPKKRWDDFFYNQSDISNNNKNYSYKPLVGGFTLIEMLIVIGIIGILATAVFIIISPARSSARDARRKIEITEIGRLLTLGCFVPNGGDGDYDLQTILNELKAKYPRYANQPTPRDPAKGTATESFYRYIVDSTTRKCSVYANLENANEKVTIPEMNSPAAGGGAGVWQATSPGWNGTDKYFQFSN